MITIHKHHLSVAEERGQNILTHKGAIILTAQAQKTGVKLWVHVDDLAPKTEVRTFVVCGTGQPAPGMRAAYISTVQIEGDRGVLVVHVFETT